MKRKTIDKNNPLGSLVHLYTEKLNKNGAIHLILDNETLEFYPTGYTKEGRQDVLRTMWNVAVNLGTENNSFPFALVDHNIELVSDSHNPKDVNAMRIVVRSPHILSPLSVINNDDIGWCPARISNVVHDNIKMIKGGRILKIRANFYDKYFTAKVIFGYGESGIVSTELGGSSRFYDIMDEIS